jgi:sulfite reductase (NADPH) flavoprotein alpha-component
MLGEPKLKVLLELIKLSSHDELVWMNGYLSGLLARAEKAEQTASTSLKPAVGKITIAYGTETGNAKKLATYFAARAKKNGINAKLVSLDQYRLNDLSKEEYFFTVISTQGDGEPPAAAKKFFDHIHQQQANLSNLKFGVLALGDTAYPQFCKVGEDVDAQLSKLGGERFASLQKCDTDYETEADNWFNDVLKQLNLGERTSSGTPSIAPAKKSSGKKIYSGKVLANINLNDRGSNKQTHHIEIAAEGLEYQPGDSIGIIPHNSEKLVQKILANCCCDKVKKYSYRDEELTVYELMTKKLNISFLPDRVVKKYAAIVQQEIPETKIGFGDLLKIYPVRDASQFDDVLQILEPIAPRLYSIASSPEGHSGEVHITVARNTFLVNGEVNYGLCSDGLCQWPVDSTIEFYVHHNDQFRLPADDKDIIMIGPGTGIAPFRSFVAHRDAAGAQGRNWLFFGDQHFVTDFLYQSEIQSWQETGVLTRVNVAFSRDQQEKIYVQRKMKKHAKEFFNWLEGGAHLYVCGAKEPMSVDVENTILEIIQLEGNYTSEKAEEYLNNLKEQGRYLKDVY